MLALQRASGPGRKTDSGACVVSVLVGTGTGNCGTLRENLGKLPAFEKS